MGDTFSSECKFPHATHNYDAQLVQSERFWPHTFWSFALIAPTTRGKTGQAKRESHARRQIAQALTAGAIAHYMGIYATSI